MDRLVFAVCYGLVGGIVGVGVALFVAQYIDTALSSFAVILLTSLICAIVGFVMPNTVSFFFEKLWHWIRMW